MACAVRILSILCIPVAFVSADAAAQVGVDPVTLVDGEEISGGEETIRWVKYAGQLYRLIQPDDLRTLALNGERVCVHGKLGSWRSTKQFQLIGSDRLFKVASRNALARVMQGGNVWLAGKARRRPNEPSCSMEVSFVVRLPRDREFFKLRFERYVRDANWQRLLDLGDWIEICGKRASDVRLEDVRRYRLLRDRAVREGLTVLEREIEARRPHDAESWYILAKKYIDLLGRPGRIKARELLLRAASEDGTHAKTRELLRDLGFEMYEGKWRTTDEIARMDKEKVRRAARESARAGALATPDGQKDPREGTAGATKALGLEERLGRVLEIERAVRNGAQQLAAVAAGLSEEDDAVARRIVWILANTGDIGGWDALLEKPHALSAAVRRDVADALAWREQVMELDDMIREERDPVVQVHGVEALASVDPHKSVGTLVSLAGLEGEAARARVNVALQRLTGQSMSGADEWRKWWKDNEDSFRADPTP